MTRLLLAGGGTAGHIYPLVSLAHEVLRRNPQAEVRFAGEVDRMEADLVPHEGFPIDLLTLPPANAPKWQKLLGSVRWLTGYRAAKALVRRFRPEVVVGAGGQVCAPVLMAAKSLGIPRVILEPNAIPGRANLWLGKHADPNLVGVLMPQAVSYFPAGRTEVLGYPIRPAILAAERGPSATALGLDPARTTVLVFGGSLGSEHLNEALVGLLPELDAPWAKGLQVLHLGGRRNARTLPAEAVSKLVVDYHYRDYLHEMEQALAAADVVVGRAGATSLAELTARGLPALLVPLPYPQAADDHQRHNATWMAEAGAAVMVLDAELTPERLGQELGRLLGEPERLAAMAEASRKLGKPEAAAVLADRVEQLAGR